jgi:hypothetical protein
MDMVTLNENDDGTFSSALAPTENTSTFMLVEFMMGLSFMSALVTEAGTVTPVMTRVINSGENPVFVALNESAMREDEKNILLSATQAFIRRNGAR